ncbi:MAG: DUF4156 domain-containing protein [Pseudomonadota bacterium]
MKYLLIIAAGWMISACTWVNENPAAQSVSINTLDQLTVCQKIGNIKVSVKDRIGFVKRGKGKVLSELQSLARNEALKLGANAIVADADPADGQQAYQAFVCPR